MRVAIIEDELLALNYLKNIVEEQNIIQVIEIVALRSKKQAIDFFSKNEVDLIFMDIHLGDGKSFEIFEQVELFTPIIFITAYDEYALKVFRHFTIDYLLKPFEEDDLYRALHKFASIRENYSPNTTLQGMSKLVNHHDEVNRFLVNDGNKLVSLREEDIAYFFASGKYLFITTREGKTYLYEDTIKDIITKLNPLLFFKINRKYIVHIDAIQEVIKHSSQKIELKLNPIPEVRDEVYVSKIQIPEWKVWMYDRV
ncbi:LytTR family DNA-binding domain-containing protein [Elizabethkingia sp. JS20170427COW]|uniref:LytR/AlgR family response regulator transcription factor n=1 Tax=Elizabethkingia sp. JS20170427COW TaxID=2583851 RepID=UPI001110411D|nr:LytTR family DNA-binding domain-containing protein [Elizabethkingia sp. JS20170427COW]QCX52432.1 response regulator transcription factor [Elizabethkingia sp. JS20170427COW]